MISDRIDPPVRFREEPETGEEPGRGLTSRGLLVDNHVHTRFSGHCPEEADAVSIRWAGLGRGLRVSLREHAPLPDGFELRQVGGPSPEFPSVSRAVGLSLRDRSLGTFFWETAEAGLSVGFEVDILGGRLDLTEELVSALYREARAAGVTTVKTSITTPYRKAVRRFRRAGMELVTLSGTARERVLRQLEEEALASGVSLDFCCEPTREPSACIDAALLTRLHPRGLEARPQKADGQRARCSCTHAIDLAWYSSHPCPSGCLYCYANPRL